MIKKQVLYRAAAATVLGLSLTTGVAAAQTPYQHYSYKHHGSNSQPVPTDNQLALSSVNKQNNVVAANNVNQSAQSGTAVVTKNWNGSSAKATSGDASNGSDLAQADVTVSNTGATVGTGDMATDDTPAPTSTPVNTNSVSASRVNEQNNVVVSNTVNQQASTGNAVVAHNSQGGDATSGSATNSSSASFSVSVTN